MHWRNIWTTMVGSVEAHCLKDLYGYEKGVNTYDEDGKICEYKIRDVKHKLGMR